MFNGSLPLSTITACEYSPMLPRGVFIYRQMQCVKHPTGGAKHKLLPVGGVEHSLALEQHVGLSKQGNLRSQAPLTVGQVADVTS